MMDPDDMYDELNRVIMLDNASGMFAFLRGAAVVYDINHVGICGSTAVFQAAIHGKIRMLIMLLDYGADVEKNDNNGLSPLLAAIMNGHDDCAVLLLRWKANANKAWVHGVTCLHLALKYAPINGRHLVITLLHRGADVNKGDVKNFTALMRTASSGDIVTAKILIGAGADPDIRELSFGKTAAQIATYSEHHVLAKYLTHEGNWRRRKNLMMVFKSIAQVDSDAKMMRVLQSKDMICAISSFL